MLGGMEESTCANIQEKSSQWNVTTALICVKIHHTSLPDPIKASTCEAIKKTTKWSEIDGKMTIFTKVARVCNQVKKRGLKAVPTGYQVLGASCKIPETGASQSLGNCFITFPDLDLINAQDNQGTQAEIWSRLKALQSELKFQKYDSPYLLFRTNLKGDRVAYTLQGQLLG
jgi:hypothetical protein